MNTIKRMQTLKVAYWSFLAKFQEHSERKRFIASHRGNTVCCNLCGWVGSEWYQKHMGPNVVGKVCPKCDSKPRQRMLKIVLEQGDFLKAGDQLIHVSPHKSERSIADWVRSRKAIYLSVDIVPGTAMKEMDITRMDLPDESVDVFVACHVLEHIENDVQAMTEVYRVLRKNGVAIFQVPLYGEITERVETPTPDDHFHVWHPGHDYSERYKQAGFQVSGFGLDKVDAELVRKLALIPSDKVDICKKLPAAL